MIKILEKKNCCGCAACVQKCPKSCITMHEDEEGFLYPLIDSSICIDCGLCEKVCPILTQSVSVVPFFVCAAKNINDKIRLSSSSGGVFTALAESILDSGGVVFGTRFGQQWEPIIDYVMSKSDLFKFRGSKYVQSYVGDSFKSAESLLKTGRIVLFSGTPCQIAGLKSFLRKEYDNLFTVDFICHGVPSPGVWRKYLNEKRDEFYKERLKISPKYNEIMFEDISFRNKSLGWRRYSLNISYSVVNNIGVKSYFNFRAPLDKDLFLRGFMSNMYLRPSCHFCKFRESKGGSDITLGDSWGIENVYPNINDDKGLNLCMINTMKGERIFKGLNIVKLDLDMDFVRKYNHSYSISDAIPNSRYKFFLRFKRNVNISKLINRYATYPNRSLKFYVVAMLKYLKIYTIIRSFYK